MLVLATHRLDELVDQDGLDIFVLEEGGALNEVVTESDVVHGFSSSFHSVTKISSFDYEVKAPVQPVGATSGNFLSSSWQQPLTDPVKISLLAKARRAYVNSEEALSRINCLKIFRKECHPYRFYSREMFTLH